MQQTELNALEEKRFEDVVLRYQDIVVSRNKSLGERARADVEDTDIMRAGLLRLEQSADGDLHAAVLKAQKRQ
jgi:hypothetical protein